MGNTLSGYTVQYGTTNHVQDYNAFGYPTAILGKNPSGVPYPIGVDASGSLIISTSGGGIPVTPQTVTASPHNLAASTSITIPAGAKGWTVSCLTGTLSIVCGTTASALPAGLSDGDANTTAVDITITTASASTAYVRWNT